MDLMKLVRKAAEKPGRLYEFDFDSVFVMIDEYRIVRLMTKDITMEDMEFIFDNFESRPILKDAFMKFVHDATLLERGAKAKYNGHSVHLYGKHKVVSDKLMRLLPKDKVYSVDDMATPVYVCDDDMYPIAMIMPIAYLYKDFVRAFGNDPCYD